MIELLVLSLVIYSCGVSTTSLVPLILAAIIASTSFFAVIERIAAKRAGEFIGESGVRFRGVLAGFLGLMIALLSFNSFPDSPGDSAAIITPNLAVSAVFGALLAFTFLVPTLFARFVTTSLGLVSQPDSASMRTISLLSVTILSFLFWADICDGLIALVGARL